MQSNVTHWMRRVYSSSHLMQHYKDEIVALSLYYVYSGYSSESSISRLSTAFASQTDYRRLYIIKAADPDPVCEKTLGSGSGL